MSKKTTGELLREYRNKIELSVRDAANLIKIHYTYLSRIENNLSTPGDDILSRIASEYKLSPEDEMDLFMSLKMSSELVNVMEKLDKKKVAEIMFRRSKEK